MVRLAYEQRRLLEKARATPEPMPIPQYPLGRPSPPIHPQVDVDNLESSRAGVLPLPRQYNPAERARDPAIAERLAHLNTALERVRERRAELEHAAQALSASAAESMAAEFEKEAEKIAHTIRGSAAVAVPKSARTGDVFQAHLQVIPAQLDGLIKEIRSEPGVALDATVVGKGEVKLLPRMRAKLGGIGFKFDPEGEQTQLVAKNEPTKWRWDVKALEAGTRTLNFELHGVVMVDGKETNRRFYSYAQQVEVIVGPPSVTSASSLWEFVRNEWKWILATAGTALVAVAGWLHRAAAVSNTGSGVQRFRDRLRGLGRGEASRR